MTPKRNSPINPFRVARALNATFVEGARPKFGNLGLLQTTADILASRPEVRPDIHFTDSDDELIRKAFEELRDGLAVDRFLADPKMAGRFTRLCRKFGLKLPPAEVNRRLLALRKRAGGGIFSPATNKERHGGLVERFGVGVEPAMTRLRILTGATVDDLLADADFGTEFERIASAIAPGGSPLEYRLCALQIRKNRHLDKKELLLFDELDAENAIGRFHDASTTSQHSQIPPTPGVALLHEDGRPLYLNRYVNLRESTSRISTTGFIEALSAGNLVWQPDPASVGIQYLAADELDASPLRIWELRLICEMNPAFNWPVQREAA